MKRILVASLGLVLFQSCGGPVRKREGEDIVDVNATEINKVNSSIHYTRDPRTNLCFAVLNNEADGFRNVFSIACVPCDSLTKMRSVIILNK
ncbi:hypothetical protein CLV58_1069 [Spirosoma oryzae]|uniref:Lipoprotein n=1 Tax=Spirosoma oryzae TaxID=1469603 RepID=A0A2T0T580_9BACT|nr:hypothetical protein CLV58_1069 [Spirosoma oryzae]